MDQIFIDFLNSDWRDWRGSGRRVDQLDNPEWVNRFLNKWGLETSRSIDEETRSELKELRSQMRSLVETIISDRLLGPHQIAFINESMSKLLSYPHLELSEEAGFRLSWKETTTDWPYIKSRIVLSFAKLLSDKEMIHRLKICDNKDCGWVFIDESRNRIKRWCDDKACGNLMKVRRFRERQKEKSGGN